MNRALLILLFFPLIAQSQIPDTGCWLSGTALPTPRQEIQLAELNGKIYVLAGIDETRAGSDVVEAYDPSTDSWSTIASLPSKMHHISAAVVNEKIYVLGGFLDAGFGATDKVYEYDPLLNQWTEKEPMLEPRGAATTSVVNGKIYVVGGVHTPGGPTGANEVYDPVANNWQSLEPMPVPREHLASATDGTLIYVAGGRNGSGNTNRFESYDPDSNQWTQLPDLPTARSGIAAAHMDGKIYVFGGEIPGVYEENEEYDLTSSTWRRAADMPTPRHGISAAGWNGSIFIIGGGPVQGYGVTGKNERFTLQGSPFSEEFDDPTLAGWSTLKGVWKADSGYLTGTHNRKGTIISENAGCSCCTFDTFIRPDTSRARCSLVTFYQDKRNLVEVIMMTDRGKWSLRHRVDGRIQAKKSAKLSIQPGHEYHIQLEFAGNNLQLIVDGAPLLDLSVSNPGTGQAGFRVKSVSGNPESCSVEQITID